MTALFAYWVDTLDPFLVRFHGNFGIKYYGLSYVLGLLAGAWLLNQYARAGRSLLPAAKVGDFIVAAAFGVFLGGRIGYYLLYVRWGEFWSDPLGVFRVWDGGMASHGGMIGVFVATAWFCRAQRIPFPHVADLVASVAPAGLFFGRVANFINGELWGKPSTVPWAVIFPRAADPGEPRHPSQLYEAGLEGLLLFAWMQLRFWKSDLTRVRPGALAGEFLIGYAIARTIGEMFREPDAPLILGLSRGTFYSLFLVVFGLILRLRRSAPLPAH